MGKEKLNGRMIIDEFQALKRIINRWDTILEASRSDDENSEVWRDILEDEGSRVLDELCKVKEQFENNFSINEYLDELFRKYSTEEA